jgi:hypothetical protein
MSLGIILTPYGQIPGAYPSAINYSYGGNGQYLCPPDPQFNTRGEQGLYFDTQLGNGQKLSFWQRMKLRRQLGQIPTDAELSTVYQYTPVASGWVASKEAYYPNPWLPPNGWNQAGAYGPQPQLRGLAEGEVSADAHDVIAALNAHNARVFALTLVSTAAVAISATLGAYRTLKLLRERKK